MCRKCKGVKEANMPLYCTCAGDFEHTLTDKVSPLNHWPQPWRCWSSLFSHLFLFLSPPLVRKELLWADHGVSEHSVPLQHELLGGDNWLVTCHESKHQLSLSLSSIDGKYLKLGEPLHTLQTKNGLCCYSNIYVVMYCVWILSFCC